MGSKDLNTEVEVRAWIAIINTMLSIRIPGSSNAAYTSKEAVDQADWVVGQLKQRTQGRV